jgi:hypothetical protein
VLDEHLGQDSGAANRIRTYDPIITNDVLYQLSYRGKPLVCKAISVHCRVDWWRGCYTNACAVRQH